MLDFNIANLIKKAKLVFIKDEPEKLQKCQIAVGDGEPVEAVRLQQSGVSSAPEKGSETVVISIGGNLADGIVIAIDDSRVRPQVAEGETCFYNPSAQQSKIILKKDSILIQPHANGTVTIDGNLTVNGSVDAAGEVSGSDVRAGTVKVSDIVTKYNSHTHTSSSAAPNLQI
jgi:phage gp45-like